MSNQPKNTIHIHSVKRKRPVLKTVLLTPIVWLWLIVIAFVPKLKKFWDPSPLNVRIVGKITSSFIDYHLRVFVMREPRPDEINPDNPATALPIRETLAVVVDRPQMLLNISGHTVRTIERAIKKEGYLPTSFMVMVGTKPAVHVL